MLWMYGDTWLADEKFVLGAEMATRYLDDNTRDNGPSLTPWVPFVCVAPVTPQGITCSRPRRV